MDRLYKAVWEKVNEGGAFTKALFTYAYNYKKKNLLKGMDTPMFNKYVITYIGAYTPMFNKYVIQGLIPV